MQKCFSSTVIIVDNNFSEAPSSTSVLSRDPVTVNHEGFKPLPLPTRVVVGLDNPQITPLGFVNLSTTTLGLCPPAND